MDDRRARQHSTQRDWNHLTLLAETTEGYHNLIKLCTLGYLEGYYYKPRVDYALLEQYADGIIALSGCLSGRTCQALLAGDAPRAREELDRLVQIFGREDVYIELQDAGIDEHKTVNPGLLSLAAETGLPVVGTGDVHYLRAEDATPHEALLCIQTNDLLSNPKRFRFSTQDFFLKTAGRDEPERWRPGAATGCSRRRSRSPSAATSRSTSTASTCRASTRPATTRSGCSAGSASRA